MTLEMLETRVRPLGQEDPLEEGMAAHSSVPARRTQGLRRLGIGATVPQTVGHDGSDHTQPSRGR